MLDGALGFVDVEAACAVFALVAEGAYFGEVVGEFFFRDVYEAEFFHAGGIDHEGFIVELEHLGKGRGVFAFCGEFGYVAGGLLEGRGNFV